VLDLAELGHLGPPSLEIGEMGKFGKATSPAQEVRGITGEELVKLLLLRHKPSDEGIDPGHSAPSTEGVTDL
jgi:hypothetical protein